MYQATGSTPDTAGFINITDLKSGKVGFAATNAASGDDSDANPVSLNSTFVKSVKEIPYNISIIQISHVLTSPEAEAPSPTPEAANITTNVEGGLTVFWPSDAAFSSFLPKFKNLTKDDKNSLLLYHGIPIYNSMAMLKSSNELMNTLATDGKKKFDFTVQNEIT